LATRSRAGYARILLVAATWSWVVVAVVIGVSLASSNRWPSLVIISLLVAFALWAAAALLVYVRSHRSEVVVRRALGNAIGAGFWRSSPWLRARVMGMALLSVAVFVSGAVVLPRGTGVVRVGAEFLLTTSDGAHRISATEAWYLEMARGALVPGGMALCLLTGVALISRGLASSTNVRGLRPVEELGRSAE